MRLIDADMLPKFDGTALSAIAVIRAIENAPTVVPSVPEGEWLPRTDYNGSLWWECSRCGYKAPDDDIPFNYCPECGAQNGGV